MVSEECDPHESFTCFLSCQTETCCLKKIRDPTAEAVTTLLASSVVSLNNPVANQVDLAEEKIINTVASKKCLHEQVTSNHLSYIPIILIQLSKYTEITPLLYLVLLKEKNRAKRRGKKKEKYREF